MSDLIETLEAGRLDFPLMLAGSDTPTGTLEVRSPWDGRRVGTAATSGPQQVDATMGVAWSLYRDRGGWLPVHRRIEILDRLAALMTREAEGLALVAASEGGKPLADSRVEVHRAIDGVKLCIETLRTEPGQVVPIGTTEATAGRIAFTRKEPVGVVVAVSAFNHPLNLIVHQVAPAVAAGCPVVVKPANDTPLSCLNFARLLHDAGLPPEWCQVVVAEDLDTAEMLVTDRRVGFLSFIGSAKVGWMLRSKLAPGARCALEHGGVAPVVVAGDCDRELALTSVLKGGFYHAGQVCVSVQRVFVPREEAEAFARDFGERANKLVVGDPTDEATEVGPLIRPAEVERVGAWVTEAVEGGATVVTGGMPLHNHCYAPTVLLDPPADCRVSREEIFGPVVAVYGYDRIEEAVRAANDLPTAFQAAVFSRDIDLALRLYHELDASAVMINDHTAFRDDVMPFAGLRESGLGVGGIPYTLDDMQVEKMAVIRSKSIPSG